MPIFIWSASSTFKPLYRNCGSDYFSFAHRPSQAFTDVIEPWQVIKAQFLQSQNKNWSLVPPPVSYWPLSHHCNSAWWPLTNSCLLLPKLQQKFCKPFYFFTVQQNCLTFICFPGVFLHVGKKRNKCNHFWLFISRWKSKKCYFFGCFFSCWSKS